MPVRNVLIAMACLGWTASAVGQAPVAEPAPLAAPSTTADMMMAPGSTLIDGGPIEPAMPDPRSLPPIPQSWLLGYWDPQPRLELRGEVVFLRPSFSNSDTLANQVQSDGTAFSLNPVSLENQSDYIAGLRLALELHLNEFKSIEASGFFLDGPRQRGAAIGSGDFTLLLTPIVNAPADFPGVADNARLDWDFESVSGEVNFLHHFIFVKGPVSDTAIGIGARYFGAYESTSATFVDELTTASARMSVSTDNTLVGPQLLFRTRVQWPMKWLRTSAEAKVGFMTNSFSSEPRLQTATTDTGGADFHGNIFSPLFEGNFLAEVFVTKHLTIFGGFQLLYVDRMVRAAEQFSPDLATFVGRQKEYGDLFLYGPRVGVLLSY